MKTKFVVAGIPVLVLGIMLNNGLISRASTIDEARNWAEIYLEDRNYSSSYTSEETLYDEYGNPVVVDVPDGALVTIHWNGGLVERNDQWGKNWCFDMELISYGKLLKDQQKCVNLARNFFTGKLLNENPF